MERYDMSESTHIRVTEKTHDIISYFAYIQNKSVTTVMKEFSDKLLEVIFNFKKANVDYEVNDGSLFISVSGLRYNLGVFDAKVSTLTSDLECDRIMRSTTEKAMEQAEAENQESEVDKKIRECFGDVEK